MAITFYDIDWTIPGANLSVGPTLTTWTDIGEYIGADGLPPQEDRSVISQNIYLEVYKDPSVFLFQGQKHPSEPECYCTGVTITSSDSTGPKGVASNSFRVAASWAMPTFMADRRGVQVSVDHYQQYENKNFDIFGNQTIAYYTPAANPPPVVPGTPPINFASYYNTRPGNIRVPRTSFGLRVVQYEEIDERQGGTMLYQATHMEQISPAFPYLPVWNSKVWNDMEKGTVLYLGRRVTNEFNSRLCRMEYSLMVNPLGWDKQFVMATMPSGETPGVLAKNNPADYALGGTYGPGEYGPGEPNGFNTAGPAAPINGIGCYQCIYDFDLELIIPNVQFDYRRGD